MIKVQQLIDEAVQKNNQVRSGARDSDFFHVSDAGTCYRKRYFKRLGVPASTEIAVASLRKMVAGDAGHEMLQKLLYRAGTLFASEGTVQNGHIKGHFDAIIKDESGKCLVEFKTIEKWAMGYIKKDGPKKEHLIQMFSYWKFLRGDYREMNQATLTYVKREDFEAVDFNFLWDDAISNKVQNEWEPLVTFWEKQIIPPCTCNEDYGGKGVNYCRYPSEDGETCCSEELINTIPKEAV